MDDRVSAFTDLAIHFGHPDRSARRRIWHTLAKSLCQNDGRIELAPSARNFLQKSAPHVDLNGHEMSHCFKIAISLATSASKSLDSDEDITITVEDEHLKEAMNKVYEFCEYMTSIHGGEATRAQKWSHRNDFFERTGFHYTDTTLSTTTYRPAPSPSSTDSFSPGHPTTHTSRVPSPPRDPELTDDMSTAAVVSGDPSDRESEVVSKPAAPSTVRFKEIETLPRPRVDRRNTQKSLTLDEDSNLCIPELNKLEWNAFQAAGNKRELFRKTSFYAVDVLDGEPMIKLNTDNNARRRRNNVSGTTEDSHHGTSSVEVNEVPLPERIRINSPSLIKAISQIVEEEFSGPFLIFRPFRSLIYYEQALRDWATQQERVIEGKLSLEQAPFFH